MSIGNYLTALDESRDALARNLVTMGVQASETEKLNTLVPKVLQIPQTNPDITLFRASIDALHDYCENVYTFYNDGYRSLAGFTESYEHFCCEENGYAIYYNQPDFNWGAVIYTMCVEPVRISSNRKIMLSYRSGATDIGEMWLVPKSNQHMSEAETARTSVSSRTTQAQGCRSSYRCVLVLLCHNSGGGRTGSRCVPLGHQR